MPTTSTAFLSAVLASRSKYFCKFTLETAASNESPFLQTACCPQPINNYRDPKCEVLSMYFPTPGKFLFSSHVWNSGLAQKERAWGGGVSPELPTQSCLLFLTWFHVRPHLQCGLCLHLPNYTWPWTPTQQHSVNMKQPRKYFPCVLSSFGILLILHVISMTLQVTLRKHTKFLKCKGLKSSVRNEVLKG